MVKALTITRYVLASYKADIKAIRYALATLIPIARRAIKLIARFIGAWAAILLLLLIFGLTTRSYAWHYHNPAYINGHSDQTVVTIGTSPDDNTTLIISLTQPVKTYWQGSTFFGGIENGVAFYSYLIPLTFFLTCAFFSCILIMKGVTHGTSLH